MSFIFAHTFAAVVFFLAGFFTFFVIFDRAILQMPQGSLKTALTYMVMIVFFLGPPAYGYLAGFNLSIWIPVTILLLFLVGEIYRHKLRKHFHGSNPVNTRHIDSKINGFVTTRSIAIREYKVNISQLPDSNHIRIVHMTDFHVDNDLPPEYYAKSIDLANKLEPDLVFLTGDFIDRIDYVERLTALFQPLNSRLGKFAVLGNHDDGAGPSEIRSALVAGGLDVLSGGSSRKIVLDSSDRNLTIRGIESPWNQHHLQTPQVTPESGISIFLCHNPDYIFKLRPPKPHLMFSGHLHGGQWRFPALGPLVIPSKHGRLLDHGHYLIQNTHLFVSSGIGTAWFPMRIRCEPEILVVDLIV